MAGALTGLPKLCANMKSHNSGKKQIMTHTLRQIYQWHMFFSYLGRYMETFSCRYSTFSHLIATDRFVARSVRIHKYRKLTRRFCVAGRWDLCSSSFFQNAYPDWMKYNQSRLWKEKSAHFDLFATFSPCFRFNGSIIWN